MVRSKTQTRRKPSTRRIKSAVSRSQKRHHARARTLAKREVRTSHSQPSLQKTRRKQQQGRASRPAKRVLHISRSEVHLHPAAIHAIPAEFDDAAGILTQSVVNGWLQQNAEEQSQSQPHFHSRRTFRSIMNFIQLKVAEIDKLTHHESKLHPSRVRVFASLLKLFIETLCAQNPAYSFIKRIMKDISRSLFVDTEAKAQAEARPSNPEVQKDLDLSTFQRAKLYSEELQALEDMVLDSHIKLDMIRHYIARNRQQRTTEIVNTRLTASAQQSEPAQSPPLRRKPSWGRRAKTVVSALYRAQSGQSQPHADVHLAVPRDVDFDADDWSPKLAGGVERILDSKLHYKCFAGWQTYLARRLRFREDTVQRFRAILKRPVFARWKRIAKEQMYERTARMLHTTRLDLLEVRNAREVQAARFAKENRALKQQLHSILTKEQSVELTSDSEHRRRSNKDKVWNNTIALHAMHVLEYKKAQMDAFLTDASAIDPCSIRRDANQPLPVPRAEYFATLRACSTEQLVLLWTNTRLSRWVARNAQSKTFLRFASLIGTDHAAISNVTNFSKDWTDGKLYVMLLHSIWPTTFSLSALQDLPAQRLHLVCDFAKTMGFNTGPFIMPRDILNECSDLNLAFLGALMLEAPNPRPSASNFPHELRFITIKYERCQKLFRSARVRGHDRMKIFLAEILATVREIDKYLSDAVLGARVWNDMTTNIALKVATVLAYRYRHKQPMHPDDPVEQAILARMCTIPRRGIEKYLSRTQPDQDYADLCTLLRRYAEDLREVFDLYCRYDKGHTQLSVLSWMVFARNLRITDKVFSNLSLRALIKAIVSPGTARRSELAARGEMFDHSEAMLDRELFSKSVVCMAGEKWAHSSKLRRLTDKVALLLDRHLKLAKRNPGEQAAYQHNPCTKSGIEAIFKDHGRQLKQIYFFYSRGAELKEDAKDKKGRRTGAGKKGIDVAEEAEEEAHSMTLLDFPMKMSQFRSMVKHAGLAETSYSNQVSFLDSLVDQITRIMNENIAPNATEIVYEEFLEMLAIMCILRNPDPYQPLNQKLPPFLEMNLIKPIYGTVMSKKNT